MSHQVEDIHSLIFLVYGIHALNIIKINICISLNIKTFAFFSFQTSNLE